MELTSFTFLVFAIVVIVLSNCFASKAGRQIVLAFSSAVFIGSYANSVVQLMPLLIFLVLCYGVVTAVQRRPSTLMLWLGLIAILLSFIYLKQFSFIGSLPALPFTYAMVGLSYILFRVIHLAVDIRQGVLRDKIEVITFFNYTCNFLSFTSGPIQRYRDFVATSNTPLHLNNEKVFAAFSRVVKGFVKVVVISAIANYLFELVSTRLVNQGSGLSMPLAAILFAATATVYMVYLYYNFSGYMDIVIGIGRLMGFDLPENFNKPFLSKNFLEFWSRWHITLSDWFKTYVFNPLMKFMVSHKPDVALQPALGVIAFFVTFLLMGMWHGTTSIFLLYGVMMGAGASANKLWQIAMARFLGKRRYKALADNTLYACLCTGMTCAWFAIALTCFWIETSQFTFLVQLLGAQGMLLAFCALAITSGAALGVARYFAERFVPTTHPVAINAHGLVVRNLLLGTHVMVIAVVVSFFHKTPEFVYRAF